MKPLFLALVLASALGLVHGAGALTLDTRTPVNPDGSAKFVDPDRQVENLASPSANGSAPGSKSYHSGSTTFSFGVTSGDRRGNYGRTLPFNNFGVSRGFRGFDRSE
jgi:hypothetical protein